MCTLLSQNKHDVSKNIITSYLLFSTVIQTMRVIQSSLFYLTLSVQEAFAGLNTPCHIQVSLSLRHIEAHLKQN